MTVFLLEDHPANVTHIRGLLEREGCRVVTATTILEGQMIASGLAEAGMKFEAAFLDHDLPYDHGQPDSETHTGADIAKVLLAHDPGLPVVAISAVESNNDHLESVGAFLSNRKDTLDQDRMKELLSACRNWRRLATAAGL